MIAVIGKTEGNGGVNDFTRILADQAFRRVLLKHGRRSEAEDRANSDGVVGRLRRRHHAACHRVRAQRRRPAAPRKPRLVIGTAHERGAHAGGHRPAGDGREGRRRA